jgi:hypothetical protein
MALLEPFWKRGVADVPPSSRSYARRCPSRAVEGLGPTTPQQPGDPGAVLPPRAMEVNYMSDSEPGGPVERQQSPAELPDIQFRRASKEESMSAQAEAVRAIAERPPPTEEEKKAGCEEHPISGLRMNKITGEIDDSLCATYDGHFATPSSLRGTRRKPGVGSACSFRSSRLLLAQRRCG